MWPDADTTSFAWSERARKVFAGGSTRLQVWIDPYPIYLAEGEGAYVRDVDGNRYFDLTNNFASLIHGHAHPEIVRAVGERVARGTCFTLPTPADVELAELLLERLPRMERIRFLNSGTEAVMMAIRAARAYSGRPLIAKVEGAYHGMYDHAEISLDSSPETWGQTPNAVPFSHGTPEGVLADTLILPFNDVEAAEALLRQHGDRLAGVLLDPVPATCGMIPATPEFAGMLRRVCDEFGAALIYDEVVSFRYGHRGAQGRFGGEPDLTTLAKIIGGGFPVGAVAGRAEVMAVFDQSEGKPRAPASGTFSANPVSMTAGRVSMELLDAAAFDRLEALGDHARRRIAETIEAAGWDGQVTGVGSNFIIHPHRRPITDYRTAWRAPAERAKAAALQRGLLRRGVFLAGTGAGFISTVTTEADLDMFADALAAVLREI